ncbi:MAG: hypothetical protein E7Z96_08665 [Actinomycetaceae bacterium]|nr:hypothetical protein [Actinomycetaceae bacterium]
MTRIGATDDSADEQSAGRDAVKRDRGHGRELESPSLEDKPDTQSSEAQQYAVEFLRKVIRIRGVQIRRDEFLRQEFRKYGLSEGVIGAAIATTPTQAGIEPARLDELADSVIAFETKKSTALSFATGLPGGLAMFATVPSDVTQYYVHALRVMQKLAYIYGWHSFLNDLDEVDDETVAKVAVFFGVMLGVGGASASLITFAQQVARPAMQKQIAKQALTKTAWYPVVKRTLSLIGVKVTKDSFAKTVTKAVPLAGGVVSGAMTFVALRSQSQRLKEALRHLPPPGADAAEYLAALDALGGAEQEVDDDERAGVQDLVERASTGVSALGCGIREAAGTTRDTAAEGMRRAKGVTAKLLRRGTRQAVSDGADTRVTGDGRPMVTNEVETELDTND